MAFRVLNMLDVSSCPDVLDPLRSIGEVVTLEPNQTTLAERIGEFDAYLASLHARVDIEVLRRADRLRLIATPSTGTDHIDLEGACQREIEVLSLKNDTEFLRSLTATAELAWALVLNVARRLPCAIEAARAGRWARDEFRGRQLSGKTLGIIGYGRLGTMVAHYGLAFGMRVFACDPRPVQPEEGVQMVDRDTLLRESDVISIHIHLTSRTRGLIDRTAFTKMKPGAIVINTSRGAVIDEVALLSALDEGRIAGAGLDVIEGEWRDDLDRHPLVRYARTYQNLVITPHVGGVTHESQRLAISYTIDKIVRFLKGHGRPEPL